MDRSTRHLAAAAALSLLAAGCGAGDDAAADDACDVAVTQFDLVEPDGFTRTWPGEPIHLTWAPPPVTGLTVALALRDGDDVFELPPTLAGVGELTAERDRGGAVFPVGIYRIEAGFSGCTTGDVRYDAGALRVVYVQGARSDEETLTLSDADPAPVISFRTVSLASVDVEVILDPSPGTMPEDAVLVDRISVPGELVAMNRDVAFSGLNQAGAAVPYGDYRLVLKVYEPPGTTAREFAGPLITWGP